MSYDQIHSINNRATPNQMMKYKHALLLFKIWNVPIYPKEWLALNFQQNFSARGTQVRIFETNKLKIGKNLTVNRLKLINGLIEYKWLNMKPDTYKFKCKTQIFLYLNSCIANIFTIIGNFFQNIFWYNRILNILSQTGHFYVKIHIAGDIDISDSFNSWKCTFLC